MDKKKTAKVSEGNRYDKVLKENARKIFTPLLEQMLETEFKRFEPRQEKMQTTLEREMDFFYEIFTTDEQLFFLHLEFQTVDEEEIILRIGEYVAMAQKRWKKPIKPVVIHLGKNPSKMRTELREEEIYRGFQLLNVCELSPFKLLDSEIPELVILAIYSDYKVKDIDQILTLIILRLQQICTKRQLEKFSNQLIMLSKLRKLENITTKKVAEMINYKMEEDGVYLMGVQAEKERSEQAIQAVKEKARKKAALARKKQALVVKQAKQEQDATILKLLKLDILSIADIAEITNVSEAYVYHLKP